MTYIITRDPYLEIQKGNVSGSAIVHKFGRNVDVDTAAAEDVWDGGGLWAAPTAARTHDIASTSANDASGGTGARTVKIYGLDASYALQEETVTMNGVSNVETANTYTMIHRMVVITAGSENANVGTITATAQTDATVTAQISALYNQTLMAIYQIPAAKTGYLRTMYVATNSSGGVAPNVDATLFAKPDGEVFQTKMVLGVAANGSSHIFHRWEGGLILPAKMIVKVQAETSANNSDVSAGFDIILVDD